MLIDKKSATGSLDVDKFQMALLIYRNPDQDISICSSDFVWTTY